MKREEYHPLYSGGFLFIGQDADGKLKPNGNNENYDPMFDIKQSFSGQITQVELWNIELSASDIEQIANCKVPSVKVENQLVTWKSNAWVATEVTFTDIPSKELCQRNGIAHKFILQREVSYSTFSSYCDTFDGILPLPFGEEGKEWQFIYDRYYKTFEEAAKGLSNTGITLSKKSGSHCFSENRDLTFWTGLIRHPDTGQWYSKYNFYDFTKLNIILPSEVNRCVFMVNSEYLTAECSFTGPCGICRLSEDQIIYLKGLCKQDYEHLDEKFYIHGVINSRPYFK